MKLQLTSKTIVLLSSGVLTISLLSMPVLGYTSFSNPITSQQSQFVSTASIPRLSRSAAQITQCNKKNKVKFNICNVHYAPVTVAEESTVSFGTPVHDAGCSIHQHGSDRRAGIVLCRWY